MEQALTPGHAAYLKWKALQPYPNVVGWEKLPSSAKLVWEKLASAARAFVSPPKPLKSFHADKRPSHTPARIAVEDIKKLRSGKTAP